MKIGAEIKSKLQHMMTKTLFLICVVVFYYYTKKFANVSCVVQPLM